jgi:hypothetical protein
LEARQIQTQGGDGGGVLGVDLQHGQQQGIGQHLGVLTVRDGPIPCQSEQGFWGGNRRGGRQGEELFPELSGGQAEAVKQLGDPPFLFVQ